MRFEFDLGARPTIVQCGLCLHGSRSKESFCMRGLWSLHAYRYRGEMRLRGEVAPFRAGCVSVIPPDVMVEWHFPSHAPHYYVHFAMGRSGGRPIFLPLLTDMGGRFERYSELFEELIEFQRHDRLRAEVRLWDLLHQVHEDRSAPHAAEPLHPSLQIALSIIRNRQSESLLVGGIARQMGVSHNHLTLLFKKHLGCGVSKFIQRDRIARACHLLTHSSLSIKSIAIETGLPDLQYFNKLIRKATGRPPRDFRAFAFQPEQKALRKHITASAPCCGSEKPALRARMRL